MIFELVIGFILVFVFWGVFDIAGEKEEENYTENQGLLYRIINGKN